MQTHDSFSTVLTKAENSIGVITLNHGKVNTLSRQLTEDMCAALAQMKSDSLPVIIRALRQASKSFPRVTMCGSCRPRGVILLLIAIRFVT